MYDPSTARFLSKDPLEEAGGSPNLYLYCANDPVNRSDPSGSRILYNPDDKVTNALGRALNARDILQYELFFTYGNKPYWPAPTTPDKNLASWAATIKSGATYNDIHPLLANLPSRLWLEMEERPTPLSKAISDYINAQEDILIQPTTPYWGTDEGANLELKTLTGCLARHRYYHIQLDWTRDFPSPPVVIQISSFIDYVRDGASAAYETVTKGASKLLKAGIAALMRELGVANPDDFFANISHFASDIAEAIPSIIRGPGEFVTRLVEGIGGGFDEFVKHFPAGALESVLKWVLEEAFGAEVLKQKYTFPTEYTPAGFGLFFLELAGLNPTDFQEQAKAASGKAESVAGAFASAFDVEDIEGAIDPFGDDGKRYILENLAGIKEQLLTQLISSAITQVGAYAAGGIVSLIRFMQRVVNGLGSILSSVGDLLKAIGAGIAAAAKGAATDVAQAVYKGIKILIGLALKFLKVVFNLDSVTQTLKTRLTALREFFQRLLARAYRLLRLNAGVESPYKSRGEMHRLILAKSGKKYRVYRASQREDAAELLDRYEKRTKDNKVKADINEARKLINTGPNAPLGQEMRRAETTPTAAKDVKGVQAELNKAAALFSKIEDSICSTGQCFVGATAVRWEGANGFELKALAEVALGAGVETFRGSDGGWWEPGARRLFAASQDRAVWLRQERGDGGWTEVGLIRSRIWLEKQGAVRVGASVDLKLPEMGASGLFEVVAVEACPAIRARAGCVVTGVFRHGAGRVYDLWVEGESAPLGVTAGHPIWSADRGAWVSAGALQEGECVQGVSGPVRVLRMDERGDEPVFTLEVDGDHCFRVGEQGILVHNASVYPEGPLCEDDCDKVGKTLKKSPIVVNGRTYTFEWDKCRTTKASGPIEYTPDKKNQDRNPTAQTNMLDVFFGSDSLRDSYAAGHLIGNELGGPGGTTSAGKQEITNFVPMPRAFNSSRAWYRMEAWIKLCLTTENPIKIVSADMDIEVKYNTSQPPPQRDIPTKFKITVTTLKSIAGGKGSMIYGIDTFELNNSDDQPFIRRETQGMGSPCPGSPFASA